MPSGPPICALRASARRISANGFSGWSTPDGARMNDGADLGKHLVRLERLRARHKNSNGAGLPLAMAAQLAGWRSAGAADWQGGTMDMTAAGEGRYKLRDQAALAGWPTPHVLVIEKDIARRRDVVLGLEEGPRVEVVTGLKPGEVLVVAGQQKIADGDRVQLED